MASLAQRLFRIENLVVLLPVAVLFSRAIADIIATFLGLFFVYRSYKLDDWAWVKKPWVKIGIALWLYLVFIVPVFAVNPGHSLFKGFAFIRWILFAAALGYWVLSDEYMRRIFQRAVVFLVIFIVLDSLLQYVTGLDLFLYEKYAQDRLTGPFGKPIAGLYTLKIIFISMATIYFSKRSFGEKKQIALLVLLLFLGIAFIFITGGRNALMLMLLGTTVIFITIFVAVKSIRKILTVMLIVGAIGGIALALTQPVVQNRVVNVTIDNLTHLDNWHYARIFRSAIAIWSDHKITGAGMRAFREECPKLDGVNVNNDCAFHPHNPYLDWLVSAGLIGFFGFCLLGFYLFRETITRSLLHQNTMMGAFTSAILLSTFWPLQGGQSIFSNGYAAISWMGIGWALAASHSAGSYLKNKV